MKTIRNLIIVLALSVTFAIADEGHTGSGNRCETSCPPPPCTENCGGIAPEGQDIVVTGTETEDQTEETSLIDYWSEMFYELIG